jgi:hypothetical protein
VVKKHYICSKSIQYSTYTSFRRLAWNFLQRLCEWFWIKILNYGILCIALQKGKQGEFRISYRPNWGKEYSYHSDETRRNLNENFAPDKFQNLSLNDAINLEFLKVIPEELQFVKMLFDLSKLSLAFLTMIWLKFRMIKYF